jgi:hypothetical protein
MKTRTWIALAILAALGGSQVNAGSRSSAAYNVPADTIDAGGRRATSANYTIDGSVGSIGGIGTAVAPATTAKHSYIGQLYDVTNIVVAANPANVNEGATTQLSAAAALDDGTGLAPPASSVQWYVVNGPINSINAAGLATAGVVYQNTPATAGGRFLGRSNTVAIQVLDINPDNFGLYAGDGIDDAWQVQYFGVGNPQALPGGDPDGDGQTNRYEYIVGTIPTDPASLFRLRIEKVGGFPLRKNLIFSPRFPSRTYTPEYRVNVDSGVFAPVPLISTSDVGVERTVTDLQATNDHRFYRIRVTFP